MNLTLEPREDDTVSCEHVRQGDYVVIRLFMCHDCIAKVRAAYIAICEKEENERQAHS